LWRSANPRRFDWHYVKSGLKSLQGKLPPAPLLKQLSVREYQREAIAKPREYVAAHRQKETKQAVLVHLA